MDNAELRARSRHKPGPTPEAENQSERSARIDAQEELRAINTHLFKVQENERQRFARDLHVETALGQGTIITATVPG